MKKALLWLLKFLIWAISIIPVTVYQSLNDFGRWLERLIRKDGWERSLAVYILGAPIAGVTGWEIADKLSFVWDFGKGSWTFDFIVATVLMWVVVWPGFYYLTLRFVWNALEKVYKHWDRFCEHVLTPALADFVDTVRKAPGADKLWTSVLPVEGGRGAAFRFLDKLYTFAALGLMAFGTYYTYGEIMEFGSVYIASHTLLTVAAMAIAATAFGVVFVMTGTLISGRVPNVMAGMSIFVAFGVVWGLHYALAVSVIASLAMAVAVWVMSMTYLLPGLVTLLQTGTLKEFVTKWYKLIEPCYYNEENKAFQLFWQHGTNLVMAPVLGYVLFSISVDSGLPVWIGLALALFVTVYSYAESGRKWFATSRGNMDAGLTFNIVTAYLVYDFVSPQGVLMGVAVGIGAFLVMLTTVYPLVYLTARAVTASTAAAAGVALEALHKRLTARIQVWFDGFRKLQDDAFNDRSDFSRLFGHLINLALVAVAVLSSTSALMDHLTGMVWLNYIIFAFISMNGLVLFGRLFSRYSAQTLATVLALSVAGPLGYYAYGASGSFLVVAGLVLALGAIVGSVFAPLAYLGTRKVFAKITPVLAPAFDKFFDGLWNLYVEIWRAIIAVVGPIVALVHGVWKSIAQSMSHIFGR